MNDMRKLMEAIREASEGQQLVVQGFNLNNIDREEPTDFPPIYTEFFDTYEDSIEEAVIEFLCSEGYDEESARSEVDQMELGADNSLYIEDDGILIRHTLNSIH